MPPTKESFGFYKKGKIWFCPCNKRMTYCASDECKRNGEIVGIKIGGAMCEHNRVRTSCKQCGGSQICNHNIVRACCKECGGGSICEHSRRRTICKECGGSQICIHNKYRSSCVQCGGSRICKHNIHRCYCKLCDGSQICNHKISRYKCNLCNPHGYIASLRRRRRKHATKSPTTHTLDDLGMTSKEWLVYLNKTFEDTYGRSITDDDDVHIDEIIPCSAWNLPEDNRYCWHYLNSQWLLAEDNLSKHDSYIENDKEDMIKRINEHLSGIKM